jgi:PhoPQ-activated pathogenicity-related protein
MLASRLFLCATALLVRAATAGELADFVGRVDPATQWSEHGARAGGGIRSIELDLASQMWRGRVWHHQLYVTIPDRPRSCDVGVLVIGASARNSFVDAARLARDTGCVVASLGDVPNQPLWGASEDALIAYTFEQHLKTQDWDWPLLFPMTKAAVRAMDAVADVAARDGRGPLRRFVVTGASKRGWTTWLAAAVDSRVAGIMPVVFDNLNFTAQMPNQIAVWGRYSEQLGDYTERSLQALIGTERGRALVARVDPYAYREALARAAKLLVNGTNDPYWELDAVNFYWNDLRGPKSLLAVPNAGHEAGSDPRVQPTLCAFVERIAEGRSMPSFRWVDASQPATATFASDEEPTMVRLWRAESPSRDFRRARWTSSPATRRGDRFVANAPTPGRGFAAFFGEAEYPAAHGMLTSSTPVHIVAGPR